MKNIVVLCLFGLVALSVATLDQEFASFVKKHNKHYSQGELPQRYATFQQSKQIIARLNAEARMKGRSTKYGITKFADMTPEEFKSTYLGYKPIMRPPVDQYEITEERVNSLPKSLDWRTKGAVTPVKDQGQCGSCWAFSATEGVESAWFLAGHKLVSLSPQQTVSCDTTDDGCDGGDLPTAFAYIQGAGGLETEADYPYTSGGGDSGSCNFDPSKVVAQISGFQYATQSMNETAMQVAMVSNGPLSICVDAETWQYYTGGIVTSDCGTDLDHCVQIVGWNSQGSTPYWIIRNSWNTDWGINGYIWVERNQDECGVAMEATYVTI